MIPLTSLRVAFLGTGDIAVPSFQRLVTDGPRPVLLVTQPDRPVGRHRTLTPPPLKPLAIAAGIPVFQPEQIRDDDACATVAAAAPDVIVVMAYGQILPKRLLEIPRLACINLHASLLPRHRGAACIQATIDSGDPEAGITVMHVAPKLDSGDLILAHRTPVSPGETGESLHDRLATLAPAALLETLTLLANGTAPRTPQDEAQVTYIGKLEREHGILDWSWPATRLERRIRAWHPWPGTHTTFLGKRLKVFPATHVITSPTPATPGTILAISDLGIDIACGQDALRLTDLQPDGSRRMSASDFARGHALASLTATPALPPTILGT